MARKTKTTKSNHRHGNKKLPDDDTKVFDVIRAKSGNLSKAATHFGTCNQTVYNWIHATEERQGILDEIRNNQDNAIIDKAITALEKNLGSADGRISNRAVDVAMRYMGKRRGYVPASYVEQENSQDVVVTVVRDGE